MRTYLLNLLTILCVIFLKLTKYPYSPQPFTQWCKMYMFIKYIPLTNKYYQSKYQRYCKSDLVFMMWISKSTSHVWFGSWWKKSCGSKGVGMEEIQGCLNGERGGVGVITIEPTYFTKLSILACFLCRNSMCMVKCYRYSHVWIRLHDTNHVTSSKRADTLICHTTMHRNPINFLYHLGHVTLWCVEVGPVANAR